MAAAAAAATPSSVTYAVGSDWGSGHTAMTVNAGSSALNGWTVEFDSPAQITNIWNAQITSHVGTHYVISNMSLQREGRQRPEHVVRVSGHPGRSCIEADQPHGQRRRVR